MHSLTFKLKHTIDHDDNGQAVASIDVYPRINGVPLLEQDGNYEFSTRTVTATGAANTSFTPFTCSCGKAECAGIYEHVQMRTEGDTVEWRFPEAPFRDTLNPKLFACNEPLLLQFNRSDYERELACLEQNVHVF